MRIAVDVGGTFTDLAVQSQDGAVTLFKRPTTPDDPLDGVFDVVDVCARNLGVERDEFLSAASVFIHGTTRAVNAILTGATARTAFLTTKGHRDILVFREGGRGHPFDFTRPYPSPFVPRALTFSVPERIGFNGDVVIPLDDEAVRSIGMRLASLGVEAVGVCLLWSIVNPIHEIRVGELLDETLPGVPYTLSHALNPSIREYRRASSACIDASLKPLMQDYLNRFEASLRSSGFRGQLLMVTSAGGLAAVSDVAAAPIHALNSGPAMAPVAGRFYARDELKVDTAIVTDTGGTSFDVTLLREGRIPSTRETWLGDPYFGHMTGFPSVDVHSIGAGGGSIAWVDDGGLLHVGPESAGAVPGPACYGRGGTRPTVTDACLILGYLDPDYFLGGEMVLNRDAALRAVQNGLCTVLRLDERRAAAAVLDLATERMVRAIEDITLRQGVDPSMAALVAGGGAAGFNAAGIARRLGCRVVLIPGTGAALSAVGGLLSPLRAEFAATVVTSTDDFDFAAVNAGLQHLIDQSRRYARDAGIGSGTPVQLVAEARYVGQIWELEVSLRSDSFTSAEDVERLRDDFHAFHEATFSVRDESSPIEVLALRARVEAAVADVVAAPVTVSKPTRASRSRSVYFPRVGTVDVEVRALDTQIPGERIRGPVILRSPFTTIIIDPDASAELTASGSVVVWPTRAGSGATA